MNEKLHFWSPSPNMLVQKEYIYTHQGHGRQRISDRDRGLAVMIVVWLRGMPSGHISSFLTQHGHYQDNPTPFCFAHTETCNSREMSGSIYIYTYI